MAIDFSDSRAQLAELVTPVEGIYRRSFKVATAHQTSVNPRATNPLQCGEFVELSSDGKTVVRGGDTGAVTGPGDAGAVQMDNAGGTNASDSSPRPAWMVWYEVGATDAQANEMVPILFSGSGFEIDTDIFVNNSLAVGKKVCVGNVTHPKNSGLLLRGLVCDDVGGAGSGTTAGAYMVGRITKLPADNGGRLRVLVHEIV